MKNLVYLILVILVVWLGIRWMNGNIQPSDIMQPDEAHLQTVSGVVTYLPRIALLSGSVVTVSVQDVSLADAPATIIGEQIITTTGENVPIPFSVDYNPADIVDNHSYSVSARIEYEGTLQWISDTHIPVITNGNPTEGIEVLLVGVSSNNPILEEDNSLENPAESPSEQDTVDIFDNSEYRIMSVNERVIPQGTDYMVVFKNGRVSTKICNSMGGDFTLSKTTITSSTMISTLMFCEGIMDIEHAFSQLFDEQGAEFSLVGDILTLKRGDIILTLERK